jgi:hypothetical protein
MVKVAMSAETNWGFMGWQVYISDVNGYHGKMASLEAAGIIGGLLFSGVTSLLDFRARRAQTSIEITKLHRELWGEVDERPHLTVLFAKERDIERSPLTDEELRFANRLFLHIRASWYAEKAYIYRRPDRLREDLVETFSAPGIKAAWATMKHLHDLRFIAFIEQSVGA